MGFLIAGYLLLSAVLAGYAAWLHRRRGALLASLEASGTSDRDPQTPGGVSGTQQGPRSEDSS